MYFIVACDTVRFGRKVLPSRRFFFYPVDAGRSFFETLVRICPITQRHISQNSNIQLSKSEFKIFLLAVKHTLGQA